MADPIPTEPKYVRLPFNSTPRTGENDLYKCIFNPNKMARDGEFDFKQDYYLKYYEGSSLDPRTNNTFWFDHYDITFVSQTTSFL